MPTTSSDQGLILPVGGDSDDVPQSFSDYNGGVEDRLVKRYLSTTDRTTRNPAPTTGELSWLDSLAEFQRYNGSKWLPLVPRVAYKDASQSVTSSTTLINDSQLFIPVEANGTFFFDGFLSYRASTTGDMKVLPDVPAGTVGSWGIVALATSATTTESSGQFDSSGSYTTAIAVGGVGGANLVTARISGGLITSATAGNLQLTWAQNVSDATATIIAYGSWIQLTAVA